MSDASNDTSGVGFPPPLLYAGGFAAGYAAHRFLPIRLWLEPTVVQRLLGWGLLVGGVLLAVSAAYLFRRAGTTPNPAKPTSALVIGGPYRFTRNPQYSVAIPTYIGLRVKRYGPPITNAEVGLAGLGVVPARRNRYAALTARSTPPTSSPQPSRRWTTVGSSHKRIGRNRWAAYPAANPPA